MNSCGGWGLHCHFHVQPNYSVEVVFCCVDVGVVTICVRVKYLKEYETLYFVQYGGNPIQKQAPVCMCTQGTSKKGVCFVALFLGLLRSKLNIAKLSVAGWLKSQCITS